MKKLKSFLQINDGIQIPKKQWSTLLLKNQLKLFADL
jgi:hypothetical protein